MRFLAHVHAYPPNHCAGAEMMLHTLLRAMVRKGHEANVIISHDFVTDNHEGIHIYRQDDGIKVMELYRWCDVVITHLDRTPIAMQLARRHGKKIVHLVHNHQQLSANGVLPSKDTLVVFNSRWLFQVVPWEGQKIIIPPPVDPEDYKTTSGDHIAITLVNLMEAKGVRTFYELARRLPGKSFLGVIGGYGRQIVPSPLPRNVEIISHTIDMKKVYGRTRILLMPSSYESWGRVAIEAAASGIPTIAHPTPGLKESLGRAGIFADRNDIDLWVAHIHVLDSPQAYAEHARNTLKRSAELDPRENYVLFEETIKQLLSSR